MLLVDSPQLCFTIKECKIHLSNNIWFDHSDQCDPVHYLNMQNVINISDCKWTNGNVSGRGSWLPCLVCLQTKYLCVLIHI